ncbi:hypothetical protein B484DRAFT_414176, partial [Ochromonadaceae sp. CCMP2298]
MEQIPALQLQLKQKDEMINVMKVKTREYVQNLKEDSSAKMQAAEAALAAKSQALAEAEARVQELQAVQQTSLAEHQQAQHAQAQAQQERELEASRSAATTAAALSAQESLHEALIQETAAAAANAEQWEQQVQSLRLSLAESQECLQESQEQLATSRGAEKQAQAAASAAEAKAFAAEAATVAVAEAATAAATAAEAAAAASSDAESSEATDGARAALERQVAALEAEGASLRQQLTQSQAQAEAQAQMQTQMQTQAQAQAQEQTQEQGAGAELVAAERATMAALNAKAEATRAAETAGARAVLLQAEVQALRQAATEAEEARVAEVQAEVQALQEVQARELAEGGAKAVAAVAAAQAEGSKGADAGQVQELQELLRQREQAIEKVVADMSLLQTKLDMQDEAAAATALAAEGSKGVEDAESMQVQELQELQRQGEQKDEAVAGALAEAASLQQQLDTLQGQLKEAGAEAVEQERAQSAQKIAQMQAQAQEQAQEQAEEKMQGERREMQEQMQGRAVQLEDLQGRLSEGERAIAGLREEREALREGYQGERAEQMQVVEGLQAQLKSLEESAAAAIERVGAGAGELASLRGQLEAAQKKASALGEGAMGAAQVQRMQNEQLSLEAQRDDLLLNIEDLNGTLATAEEELSTLRRDKDEREKALKAQLVEAQAGAKRSAKDLGAKLQAATAGEARLTSEVAQLTETVSSVRKSVAEGAAQLEAARRELDSERQQNQERKKKVRAYLDNLTAENRGLQEQVAALQGAARDAQAAGRFVEQHRDQLEAALVSNRHQGAQEGEARRREWESLEGSLCAQLAERTSEVAHLRLQVELASQTSSEEVASTQRKIDASVREMEAHKAKRLAARSEMINLAQSLERAQAEGEDLRTSVYVLHPMVEQQAVQLEQLVSDIEKVSFHLTSQKADTALTRKHQKDSDTDTSGSGTGIDISPYKPNGNGKDVGNPLNMGNAKGGEEEWNAEGSGKLGTGRHDFHSISDALVQVDCLRVQLERVQMGLMFMGLSVDKLIDIVTFQPRTCCGLQVLAALLPDSGVNSAIAGAHTPHSRRHYVSPRPSISSSGTVSGVSGRLAD